MEHNADAHNIVGTSKRKTRSSKDDLVGRTDLREVADFAKGLPQIVSLNSLEELNREEPAVLRKFISVEYKDTHRRVGHISLVHFFSWHLFLSVYYIVIILIVAPVARARICRSGPSKL